MLSYSERITKIEWMVLESKRPRVVGRNSRLDIHGDTIKDPVARLHTSGGAVGIGWARLTREKAEALLGKTVGDLFRLPDGCTPEGRVVDPALWDLAARMENKPLYQVIGEPRGTRRLEVYDTNIFFDDYGHDDKKGAAILAKEVQDGLEAGYRNFKVKIGRGARWMPIMEGLNRDILAIKTVRKIAGPNAKVLIDANDAGTVNTTKYILRECAAEKVHWFEEPFAESRPLNQDLREFLDKEKMKVLIADGEYVPPPDLFDMMRDGLIDVLIADCREVGLTWYKAAAARIEPWGRRVAPHCYSSVIDNYVRAHFVATLPHFEILEIDRAKTDGLILDGWTMRDSHLFVPETPGTGWDIEADVRERGIKQGGFCVSA